MLPYNHAADESFDMQFYFGPNHYNTLEKVVSLITNVLFLWDGDYLAG